MKKVVNVLAIVDSHYMTSIQYISRNIIFARISRFGMTSLSINAFDDDYLNQVLNLDGEEQFVVYAGTVGKR